MDTLFTNQYTESILKFPFNSVRTERTIYDFHSADSEPIGENSASFTNDKFLNKRVDEAMAWKTSKIRDKPKNRWMEWLLENIQEHVVKRLEKTKHYSNIFTLTRFHWENIYIYIYIIQLRGTLYYSR